MKRIWLGLGLAVAALSAPLQAQTFPTQDPALRRIWAEGMQKSQLQPLAQVLLDSIGPRMTGTSGLRAATEWVVGTYRGWGISARSEQYGSWRGWQRGITHIDLLQPRVRTLEGTMLPWSPGTRGPVSGEATLLPAVGSAAEFEAWLPQARGKWVLISMAPSSCRPEENWKEFALKDSYERMQQERTAARQAWEARLAATGVSPAELPRRLEQAGALGVLVNNWAGYWGMERLNPLARTQQVPTLDLSCEDYGLVYRLAEKRQGPVLRVNAEAEFPGEVPAQNAIAELRGRERPNEYVLLSAHLDSWDGSSGALDNGTGTLVMMEAMRILKTVYPAPRRTILAGHWGGEEQGLNGSRAFVADHPEVVRGLQALFNQDTGTGRINRIPMEGLTRAAGQFGKWFAQLPAELVDSIRLNNPGVPSPGSSDHASFICAGAPAFFLLTLDWGYGVTYHSNRDTYDKIVWDDVQRNATLVAMLAYLAAEDAERFPRERRTEFPVNARTGEPYSWPACQPPMRTTPAGR